VILFALADVDSHDVAFNWLFTRLCRFMLRSVMCGCIALLALSSDGASADQITSTGVLSDALAATDKIDDPRLKAQVLDMIAMTQAESGDTAGAKQSAEGIVVNASEDAATADAELGWKKDAYAAIAGGEAGRGDIDGAQATVASIIDPDTKSLAYEYIAQALARKGDIAGAKRFAALATGTDQTRADRAIAAALATTGNFEEAKAIAGSLDDDYEKVQALTAIAQAQAKAGDSSAAKQTIELARAAAANVGDYLASATWGAIAMALVKAGDLDGANSLRKIDEVRIARDIAVAQADLGDIAGAKQTIAQITDSSALACANARLALAQWRAHDITGATESLEAAKSAASEISGSSDQADACERIVEAWTIAGNPSGAAQWAESQNDPVSEVKGLITVVRYTGHPEISDAQ
jgi:hypothetical protein